MNLPNRISLLRIILVPFMTAAYLINYKYAPVIAVCIFIVAAATDFLDGYIARKRQLVTDLGKILDPIADKLLVVFALFLVVEARVMPLGMGAICGGIIIGRELLVNVIRQVAASKNVIIHANIYGKIKTIFQDISLPMLMLLKMESTLIGISQIFFDAFRMASFVIFGIAVVLTLLSGIIYIIQNRTVFGENK